MGEYFSCEPLPLRMVSFNIRYATESPSADEQPWSVRCPKLCTQLRFVTCGHSSAFICLQEVLHSQLQDIQSHLGSSWAHIGLGRDDGKAAGEFSPIFYRTDSWSCERNRTYWLSKTPEKPSRGWDAALNRIVTVGCFRHKVTGTRTVVMSTHMDHIGVKARKEGAKLIVELAEVWANEPQAPVLPVFLGGDFNSTPDDEAYKTITAPGTGMTDISDLVPADRRYGNHLTYTSFGEPNETPSRIDFLFVKDPRGIEFATFGVMSNRFDDMVYLSDHRAVVADMELHSAAGSI